MEERCHSLHESQTIRDALNERRRLIEEEERKSEEKMALKRASQTNRMNEAVLELESTVAEALNSRASRVKLYVALNFEKDWLSAEVDAFVQKLRETIPAEVGWVVREPYVNDQGDKDFWFAGVEQIVLNFKDRFPVRDETNEESGGREMTENRLSLHGSEVIAWALNERRERYARRERIKERRTQKRIAKLSVQQMERIATLRSELEHMVLEGLESESVSMELYVVLNKEREYFSTEVDAFFQELVAAIPAEVGTVALESIKPEEENTRPYGAVERIVLRFQDTFSGW